jgi:ketosteroid isomerase-like protein
MKRVFEIVAAIALGIFAMSALADEGMNEIGEAFVKAFKAGDLDGVAALYAHDAVSFPPDAMVANGQDEIRSSWGGLLNNFDVEDLIITNPHHETSGDLSTAWGNFKMILIPKQGGEPMVLEGRFSDVAKRIDGKWLYVADHASVPLPPPAEPEAN